MNIKTLFATSKRFLKIKSPQIKVAAGIVLFGTAIYLAAKGGAKSARQIDAKETELQRPLTGKEKVKLCYKNYIGTAASSVAGVASIVSSNYEMVGRIGAGVAEKVILQNELDKTNGALDDALGKKNAEIVRAGIKGAVAEETTPLTSAEDPSIVFTGPGTTLFYIPYCRLYFRSNRTFLDASLRKFNETQVLSGRDEWATIDTLLDRMLIPREYWPVTAQIDGWPCDGSVFGPSSPGVEFNTTTAAEHSITKEPYTIIDFYVRPMRIS